MALVMCRQTVELREVQLAHKPAQMIQASAKATVPVLCLPDEIVIDESLDIMLWAITRSADPEQLLSSEQQSQLDLISYNDTDFKYWLDRYKYDVRFPEQPPEYYRGNAEQFLDTLEARLSCTAFLYGPNPTLADLAIMPFIRQFAGVDRDWFDHSRYEAVKAWLADWLNSPAFKHAMKKYPVWTADQAVTVFSAPE